ncbi:MAG: hypothetical protein ACNS63_10220 [Candidatus Nitrospinota bacterium M3_3B_026]
MTDCPESHGAYFVTGTGRCGTMLLSRLLSFGENTRCVHERSVRTDLMKEAYHAGSMSLFHKEVGRSTRPLVEESNANGLSYGECSGHLYFLFPEIFREFGGDRVKFVLLVRRPDTFVASALARGFFDDTHPHGLEHVRPPKASEIGRAWDSMTPFDKCLWY